MYCNPIHAKFRMHVNTLVERRFVKLGSYEIDKKWKSRYTYR